MSKLEKSLLEEKNRQEKLTAPGDLEDRLRHALNKKRRKNTWRFNGLIAASIVCLLFVSFNYNTLAFYGKQILGFDSIMTGTLKDLNEMGNGQKIGKSMQLSNGVKVTLDGVMIDKQQMIIFYTVQYERQNKEAWGSWSSPRIKGFFGDYHFQGGYGKTNEEETVIKEIDNFEPPHFFEKNLEFTFSMNENGNTLSGTIPFELDRNKAMGYTIKQRINKTIVYDDRTIVFNDISASPTVSVVTGKIELHGSRPNNIRSNFELELYANGKKVDNHGSGISSTITGYKFDFRYEPLPAELEKLELKLNNEVIDILIK